MTLLSTFELKEFDSASLTGSYQNFGSALSNPAYYAYITNSSDVDVYLTTDGTTDQLRIDSGTSVPITYFSWHNTAIKGSFIFAEGVQIQIKQVTATGTGFISANIVTTG